MGEMTRCWRMGLEVWEKGKGDKKRGRQKKPPQPRIELGSPA